MNKKKIIFDLILIFALLVIGVSVFIIIEATRDAGAEAVVSVDGKEVSRYSLSEDGEFEINSGTNTLVIKDGKAYVIHADCPDKLCVNQGKISRGGERIVCLPNRVMIEIIGEDEILAN